MLFIDLEKFKLFYHRNDITQKKYIQKDRLALGCHQLFKYKYNCGDYFRYATFCQCIDA